MARPLDHPILFSGAMVCTILREIEWPGTGKTQTRRILDMPRMTFDAIFNDGGVWHIGDAETGRPYAKLPVRCCVGDRLWVRETWTARMSHGWTIADARSGWYDTEILYRAGGAESIDGWWPSIHMPREFSRITLIVEDVRVQRLQEISGADAVAEGVRSRLPDNGIAVAEFMDLWDSLNAKRGYGWDKNPWVTAITFRPILKNID